MPRQWYCSGYLAAHGVSRRGVGGRTVGFRDAAKGIMQVPWEIGEGERDYAPMGERESGGTPHPLPWNGNVLL